MARTRSRSPRGASTQREPRAVSRKQSAGPTAEAEIVEEAPGMGMEGAVAIVTALMLIAGCVFLDLELSKHYDAGFFF